MENDNTPLVTIGIPTYTRADGFLRNALTCAVNQTYANIEIIVSDNCSSDHTQSLVEGFADPRIRYVKHQQNIGANNNFNYCVNQAKGRYLVLLHDDDSIDEDMVDCCIRALPVGKDVGVIFTGNRVIDEEGRVKSEVFNRGAGRSAEDFLIGWFKNETALYLCSTMFNTRYLQMNGGFHSKTNLFQDVVAEVKLAYEYGRADVYDLKGSFRRHGSNRAGDPRHLKAWIIDSLYLMHLILARATTDKDRLRELGLGFFWRKNYPMANGIESAWQRKMALTLLNICFYNYPALPEKVRRRLGLK